MGSLHVEYEEKRTNKLSDTLIKFLVHQSNNQEVFCEAVTWKGFPSHLVSIRQTLINLTSYLTERNLRIDNTSLNNTGINHSQK